MIKFKKNVETIRPYNRQEYIDFLDSDLSSPIKWYGVSFQLIPFEKEVTPDYFVRRYEVLCKNVITSVDTGSFWIINHDDKDLIWFPNENHNLRRLRKLFKENNKPNSFKGAIMLQKNELIGIFGDLLLYPSSVLSKDGFLYKNIDISHIDSKFIIKISGHGCVDFLSKEEDILRQIVKKYTEGFIVKEYSGTSLMLT